MGASHVPGAGPLFASTSADGVVAIIRASKEDQAELMAADPDTSTRRTTSAGSAGRAQLARADPDEIRELVVEGWRRAAPKRLVAHYDGAAARVPGR